MTAKQDPKTLPLQDMVKGYALPGTPGFIPMSDPRLQPKTGAQWAELMGYEAPANPPTEMTPEEEEAQGRVDECQKAVDALEQAIREHRRKSEPPVLFSYTRDFQEAPPPTDAEAERVEGELLAQRETAMEELGRARRHLNSLLHQRDARERLEEQRSRDAARAEKEAAERQAREKSRVNIFKRLGIKG